VVLTQADKRISNLTGAIYAEFHHYSLGREVTLLGPDLGIVTTRAAKSRMLLHGGFWDPAVKAYYFRPRWYSPALEQFFTVDPMGFAQSSNQHGFCSPTRSIGAIRSAPSTFKSRTLPLA
jgi:RHS repeat-associated protein